MNIPDGSKVIPFSRSIFDPNSKPKTPINSITTWLDGSVVYGSSEEQARKLRSLSSGKLRTSNQNMLPIG